MPRLFSLQSELLRAFLNAYACVRRVALLLWRTLPQLFVRLMLASVLRPQKKRIYEG